jgi:hypothetical protein
MPIEVMRVGQRPFAIRVIGGFSRSQPAMRSFSFVGGA